MRYWFDTEFQDHGTKIDLISIGIVAEDGREYYAVSADYDWVFADDWLRTNVLAQLGSSVPLTRARIRSELNAFFRAGGVPEFWAECGEYDWIVLRQLYGRLTDWPEGWPFLAMDIEQWRLQLGAPAFPPQVDGLHNALEDARNCRERYRWLENMIARDGRC